MADLTAALEKKEKEYDQLMEVKLELEKVLESTRMELKMTQNKLATTEKTLAKTEGELDETKKTLQATRDELADTKKTLRERDTTIVSLKSNIEGLNEDVKDANAEIDRWAWVKVARALERDDAGVDARPPSSARPPPLSLFLFLSLARPLSISLFPTHPVSQASCADPSAEARQTRCAGAQAGG